MEQPKVTRVTITQDNTTITIETTESTVRFEDLIDYAIRPALLAIGYHTKTVDEVFGK